MPRRPAPRSGGRGARVAAGVRVGRGAGGPGGGAGGHRGVPLPAWRARFARLALTVGLRLLDLGVALEAHGQNLLVVLEPDGEPVRLVYRDLADLRVSPERLARHGVPVPELPARMVTDDEPALRRKLFGSLVAGALAGTTGSGRRSGPRWRRSYGICRAPRTLPPCSANRCPPRP
ncbi:IucA/IucC family C-terminal-domain containing protein [Streptomyces sp. INA 01156]